MALKVWLIGAALATLSATAAYILLHLEQLGIVIPTLQELERRADVANGQLGEKAKARWRDFLTTSSKFADENPNLKEIWLLRSAAALVSEDRESGSEAASHLIYLDRDAEDPQAVAVVGALWLKGFVPTNLLSSNFKSELFDKLLSTVTNYGIVKSYIVSGDIWMHLSDHYRDPAHFIEDSFQLKLADVEMELNNSTIIFRASKERAIDHHYDEAPKEDGHERERKDEYLSEFELNFPTPLTAKLAFEILDTPDK